MATFYYVVDTDEYGFSYAAETFYDEEEARWAIERLEDSLDDATVSQSYIIHDAIDQLKEQLREAIG